MRVLGHVFFPLEGSSSFIGGVGVGVPEREVVQETVMPAGWQATPANAGWPALSFSSEQNKTD